MKRPNIETITEEELTLLYNGLDNARMMIRELEDALLALAIFSNDRANKLIAERDFLKNKTR